MELLPPVYRFRSRFDREMFTRLVHYVCWAAEDPRALDLPRLNRILWYTERNWYLSAGWPLTGATFAKQHDAPEARSLASTLAELEKCACVVARRAPAVAPLYFALSKPDLSGLSGEVISSLDTAIRDICFGVTASIPNRQAHDRILRVASVGETIPCYTSLAGTQAPIDGADLDWAARLLRQRPRHPDGCGAEASGRHDDRVEEACRALEWHLAHEPSAGSSVPTSRDSVFIYRQRAATEAMPDIVALYQLVLDELVTVGLRLVPSGDEDDEP